MEKGTKENVFKVLYVRPKTLTHKLISPIYKPMIKTGVKGYKT